MALSNILQHNFHCLFTSSTHNTHLLADIPITKLCNEVGIQLTLPITDDKIKDVAFQLLGN